MRVLPLAIVTLCTLLSTQPARADLRPVTQLDDSRWTDSIVVPGFLYATNDNGFWVYPDTGFAPDPVFHEPSWLGDLIYLGDKVVVETTSGSVILDVSNPSAPMYDDDVTGSYPIGLAQYVAPDRLVTIVRDNQSFRLEIYDVSDPSQPIVAGFLDNAAPYLDDPDFYINVDNHASVRAVSNDLAYVMNSQQRYHALSGEPLGGNMGVLVYDISDPTSIAAVADLDLGVIQNYDFYSAITVDNGVLYATATADPCCGSDALWIYQVDASIGATLLGTSPPDPAFGPYDLQRVRSMSLDPATQTLRLWGEDYYEFDVSDPANPAFVCEVPTTLPTGFATGYGEFRSSGYNWTRILDPDCSGLNEQLVVFNRFTYQKPVVCGNAVLFPTLYASVLDVQAPEDARIVGATEIDGFSLGGSDLGIPVGAAHAAILDNPFNNPDLRIVDLTDPTNPMELSPYALTDPFGSELVAGSPGAAAYLRVGPQTKNSLQFIDFADPTSPALSGTWSLPSSQWDQSDTHDLEMVGSTAYLSVLDEVWVIDFSNPASPSRSATLTASSLGAASEIELSVAGNLLVTSDLDDHRLWSLDDPTDPLAAGTLPLPASTERLEDVVAAGGLHWFWFADELQAWDLSIPATPALAGVQATTSHEPGLGAIGDCVLTYFDGLLQVMEYVEVGTATTPAGVASTLLLRSEPNPTAGMSQVRWRADLEGPATLQVYDLAGRLVRRWQFNASFIHQLEWNGRDGRGRKVASGVYYMMLRAGGQEESRKVLLVR